LGHGFVESPLYSDRCFSWPPALSLSLSNSLTLGLSFSVSPSLNLYLSVSPSLKLSLFISLGSGEKRRFKKEERKRKEKKELRGGSGQWVHFIREKETNKFLNKKMRGAQDTKIFMSRTPPSKRLGVVLGENNSSWNRFRPKGLRQK